MADPLNAFLWRRLTRLFGPVKISNQGEAMIYQTAKGLDEEAGEKHLVIRHAGEYYQANCPYCNDTRRRLYVNHMFGQRDSTGRRLLFLAVCFNENCLSRQDNRDDFMERVDDINLMEPETVKPGKIVSEAAREVLPPGPVQPLDKLRKTHPARVYVQSRGFDPDELARKFQLAYCKTASRYTIASNRLIIPVYEDGKLKGWQGRYIGELDWKGPDRKSLPPKYYSCPDSDFRSRCLLNFERMKNWQTGVIVEGPTDVFAFGSMSGCVFGNTMTEYQRRKFASVFRERTGVLLLDPEEMGSDSTRKLLEFFDTQMRGRFCAVKLPEGTDPGSLGREFLRAYVKEEAARQGVKVTYRKVA